MLVLEDLKVSRRRMLQGAAALAGTAAVPGLIAPARAAEKITYLFPAPPLLPAFGPIQLAKGRGYFAQAGLDVSYAVGRGGVDVAKQVGAGNAPLGGIVADGPDRKSTRLNSSHPSISYAVFC